MEMFLKKSRYRVSIKFWQREACKDYNCHTYAYVMHPPPPPPPTLTSFHTEQVQLHSRSLCKKMARTFVFVCVCVFVCVFVCVCVCVCGGGAQKEKIRIELPIIFRPSWVCVGVLCVVMFVLLLYGIIRICQAVREEVEQDTMRLMEQMIELDQIANQCHQSGNDEESKCEHNSCSSLKHISQERICV